jgi:hypothetical protein
MMRDTMVTSPSHAGSLAFFPLVLTVWARRVSPPVVLLLTYMIVRTACIFVLYILLLFVINNK